MGPVAMKSTTAMTMSSSGDTAGRGIFRARRTPGPAVQQTEARSRTQLGTEALILDSVFGNSR